MSNVDIMDIADIIDDTDIMEYNQFDPNHLNGIDLINHFKSVRIGNEPDHIIFNGEPTPNEDVQMHPPHEKIDLPL